MRESNNIDPGTIMIPYQEGAVKLSSKPYDPGMSAIVSGADNLET